MVEYKSRDRQTTDESGGGSTGDVIGDAVDQYIQSVKSDPEMKLRLAAELQERGVDPTLLKPFIGEIEVPEEAQEQIQEEQADGQNREEPQIKTVTEKPTPDQLSEFVDEIISYVGEDYTLAELKSFVEDNPDMVETAIDMKF